MKRVLGALGLIVAASGPAVALDLKKAKFPIEYECRETHSGGIWLDEGGQWRSGKLAPDRVPYRWRLEKLGEVKDEYRKSVCERSRQGSYPLVDKEEGFCLSRGIANTASIQFCKISHESTGGANGILECDGGAMLDTDRRVLLQSGGLVFFLMGVKEPRATVTKSDCIRLDR